jgi:hypothetical protein
MIKKILFALSLLQAVAASAALPSPATGVSPTNSPNDGDTIYATGTKSKWAPAPTGGGSGTNGVFQSDVFPITDTALTPQTLTHGFSVAPAIIVPVFVCLTADSGWGTVPGDEVPVDALYETDADLPGGQKVHPITCYADATHIYFTPLESTLVTGNEGLFVAETSVGGTGGGYDNPESLGNFGVKIYAIAPSGAGGTDGSVSNGYRVQITGGLLSLNTNEMTLVYTLTGVDQTNALGIGSGLSAFVSTNRFDISGAAQGATNGLGLSSGYMAFRNTNGFTSSNQVFTIFSDNTADLGALAQSGLIIGAAIDEGTNLIALHFRNNLSLTPDGLADNGYYVDASGTGGSASALSRTNFYIRDTNALIMDFAKAQTFAAGALTNGILIVSNVCTMTNLACHDTQITWHQWTNGGARLIVLKNAQGNLVTNGTWVQTTNKNTTDLLLFRLADGTTTNVVLSVVTNCSTYTDTNSLLADDGGGGDEGGGGLPAWFDSTTDTADGNQDSDGPAHMEWGTVVITSGGTADTLRVEWHSSSSTGDEPIKLTLYPSDGSAPIVSGTAVIPNTIADGYITATISDTTVSAGTYLVAFETNPSTGILRVNTVSGANGPYKAQAYSGFPSTPIGTENGHFDGQYKVGVHVR